MQNRVTVRDGPISVYTRWLDALSTHGASPWFDEVRRRPVSIVLYSTGGASFPYQKGDLVKTEDLVTGETWMCDYQCMRPISEMEVIARVASEEASG